MQLLAHILTAHSEQCDEWGEHSGAVSVYSQIQIYPMRTLHDSLVRDVRVAVIHFPYIWT